MLTKRKKKEVLAMPNRTNLFRKISSTWYKILVKRKIKRTEKRKPTKRERIDFLPFRLSGSLATHPFFCLSLSLLRLGSNQKKKAEKRIKNHRRPDRGWKSNQKDTYKKTTSSQIASLGRLHFFWKHAPTHWPGCVSPLPLFLSPRLSCHCHCHVTVHTLHLVGT